MGVHYTILQTFTFYSLKFSIIKSYENTRPLPQRNKLMSLGFNLSTGIFLRLPRCFYCSAKVENPVIEYSRHAESLHGDQDEATRGGNWSGESRSQAHGPWWGGEGLRKKGGQGPGRIQAGHWHREHVRAGSLGPGEKFWVCLGHADFEGPMWVLVETVNGQFGLWVYRATLRPWGRHRNLCPMGLSPEPRERLGWLKPVMPWGPLGHSSTLAPALGMGA